MYQLIWTYHDNNINGRAVSTTAELTQKLLKSLNYLKLGLLRDVKIILDKDVLFSARADDLIGCHYIKFQVTKPFRPEYSADFRGLQAITDYAHNEKFDTYWYDIATGKEVYSYKKETN